MPSMQTDGLYMDSCCATAIVHVVPSVAQRYGHQMVLSSDRLDEPCAGASP
eukprot:COSAG02_NODE_24374_length_690_cov_1.047377_1_plen_50_part_10